MEKAEKLHLSKVVRTDERTDGEIDVHVDGWNDVMTLFVNATLPEDTVHKILREVLERTVAYPAWKDVERVSINIMCCDKYLIVESDPEARKRER